MSEVRAKAMHPHKVAKMVNSQGIGKTAKQLNVSRTTLWRLLKEAGYQSAWVKRSSLV